MKEYDVTALGELLIDFTESGMSAQGNPLLEANPGGAPCNVLAMLKRLAKKTAFIGKIGEDIFGKQLEKALRDVGIDTRGLKKSEEVRTTLAFVHTMEDGDREFSFYRNPGADMALEETDLDEELLRSSRIFHYGSLSMTHEGCRLATRKAVDIAEKGGAVLSFDPNLRESLWGSLDEAREQILYGMAHCQILKISDNEIQWLTGEEDFDKGIDWIRERFKIPLILLSMGKEGSRAYVERKRVEQAAFVQEKTVETTGAGDTFCACILNYVLDVFLTEDWPEDAEKSGHLFAEKCRECKEEQLQEMLRFANAAASLITTRKGALRVMPAREEVETFLNGI